MTSIYSFKLFRLILFFLNMLLFVFSAPSFFYVLLLFLDIGFFVWLAKNKHSFTILFLQALYIILLVFSYFYKQLTLLAVAGSVELIALGAVSRFKEIVKNPKKVILFALGVLSFVLFLSRPTKLDVFSGMTVQFEGYDGVGHVMVKNYSVDHDLTNRALNDFIDQLTFVAQKDGELSNGDTVTLEVVYPEEEARRLHVAFKEESHSFQVSGLIVKYKDASNLDKDLYREAYQLALKKAKVYDQEAAFYKAYYLYQPNLAPDIQSNRLIFVFSVPFEAYDAMQDSRIQTTRYISYYIPFDSSFNSKQAYLSFKTLYATNGGYALEETQVDAAIRYSYAVHDSLEEVGITLD